MFSCVHSAAIAGVDAVPVAVEADLSTGLPGFTMVGYLSSQVKEAGDRVRTALRNTGFMMPAKKATINLSPSDLRKEGPGFDLPIAIAVLAAMGIISPAALEDCMIVGGLSLSRAVEPVNGVLATAMLTKELGLRRCIVPVENVNEGSLVEGTETVGLSDLGAAAAYFTQGSGGIRTCPDGTPIPSRCTEDFSDIHGQAVLKRAALIAAAGFHNLLMSGPPGAGKSMTARRIPSILPALTREEALEVTRIHSIAGLLPEGAGILRERPFRAPHHTATPGAIAGGGRIP